MDSTQLVLLALLLGALIGGGITLLVVWAMRVRERLVREHRGALPEGFTAVLAAMDEAAAVVDASGTVVEVSLPAGALGFHAGTPLATQALRDLLKTARAAGTAVESMRLRTGSLKGQERLISARMSRITERWYLLIARDLSERERLEQMRHDFVANTSHELKTPVGAITLLAEAIDFAADEPDEVRRFAARLTAEAERLGQLTGRIMHLSRLQAADELTDIGDVAIDEVVTAAVESNAVQADSAGVELVRGGDRGVFVRGDAQILIEAVGNLIANAIAYSPRASRVGIGVRADDEAVEIAVTDQGIGISEADQERIFERFYRADQARSRRTGGTGLGLSIVKHAISRHGGEIRLWSQPDRGSTFTIRLPRTDPPAPDPEARPTSLARKPGRSPKKEKA
jgi:two-component system sensor histidine kinase SenX3